MYPRYYPNATEERMLWNCLTNIKEILFNKDSRKLFREGISE
jgi:hypothetical protein